MTRELNRKAADKHRHQSMMALLVPDHKQTQNMSSVAAAVDEKKPSAAVFLCHDSGTCGLCLLFEDKRHCFKSWSGFFQKE